MQKEVGFSLGSKQNQVLLQDGLYNLLNRLSEQEKIEFDCDIGKVDYSNWVKDLTAGMAIWCQDQNLIEPKHNLQQIIKQNHSRFDHVRKTLKLQ